MKILDTDSPAGRAIELVGDLVKQGRMSKAEARVIEDLVWHPDMPESLRRPRQFTNRVTVTVGTPTYPYPGSAGDVPFPPPVIVSP